MFTPHEFSGLALGEGQPAVPMNGVLAAIHATCGLSLVALAEDRPLRGGMDVGIATLLSGGGEVYGPALERAYYIESDLAEYPRVVVGDEAMKFLQCMCDQPQEDDAARLSAFLAKKCMEFIVRDSDGRWMLDFMGQAVREHSGLAISPEVISSAVQNAEEQRAEALRRGNLKLAARYFRLLRYMSSRLPIWSEE